MPRITVSKKLRFEVFKRDSFTCQYCGQKAPEVILQCDHIDPVAEGGTNDILNLITSCFDCNSGKGARSLSDQAVLNKQMDQLAELQARREQIEMLIEWRTALEKIKEDTTEKVAEHWSAAVEGRASLTKTGKDKVRKLVKEYGLDLVLRAIPEAIETYGRRSGDEHLLTMESIDHAFSKLGGVCRVLRDSEEKPWLRRAFYVRGILRARLSYVDERLVMHLLEECAKRDVDFDSLDRLAKSTSSWSAYRDVLEQFIESHPVEE
ncbi:HNH endonuclease [Bradyrhizobium manausense]|uniref:HNH endonuclease n=1 Tax=Bradyrhizobium manausense TaxID=989370 RepID=UPI001BA6798C|nr:HNH endonuclease [Bradyrhizobium manausense]MBR1091021.1 HNH endonuclease [Bradyrhizobium manausense]